MEILVQDLPSRGYGYKFPSITIKPFTFYEVTGYVDSVPEGLFERYLFDIKVLEKDDPKIKDCYIMDIEFLIFVKKLISVSKDTSITISAKCPECGDTISKKLMMSDIRFKPMDPAIMEGTFITLNNHRYETIVPTVKDFMRVFNRYLIYKKVDNMKLIKLIALIKEDSTTNPNEVEDDVLNAKYDDITLLNALYDLYYDRVELIKVSCENCNKDIKYEEERRYLTMKADSLIVDIFREIYKYNPIDESKIQFKQIHKIG